MVYLPFFTGMVLWWGILLSHGSIPIIFVQQITLASSKFQQIQLLGMMHTVTMPQVRR